MAHLFGKNKLKDLVKSIPTQDILQKVAIVEHWQTDYHTGTLKKDNETSREQAYNQDFFKLILGYREKPGNPYTFLPKASTTAGKIPDAVIGHFDQLQDTQNFAAVVELKHAGTDLDRPQQREGNLSPVQQGFMYKPMYRAVPFVIVSNFWQFRLYNDNQLDYEVWTLDDLVNPDDDYFLFKSWYVLLHCDNFTIQQGQSRTESWLSDIRVEQLEIGKKFYALYKDAREHLIADIKQFNPQHRDNPELIISKAQKIIDRLVFSAFAEDKGLLPDNILQRLKRDVDSSPTGASLWRALQDFFDAIDQGNAAMGIPVGYNGGLFAHDPDLNSLKIGYDGLNKVVGLSTYNFNEDLSVTILGHIFEQSISDLEAIRSRETSDKTTQTSTDRSRRKKDGIFYTPDYIVRYIVDNSLGLYLREAEERFKVDAGLTEDLDQAIYAKREIEAYTTYLEFLRGVTVVDPACGSGAFLVYVLDYLFTERLRVLAVLGTTAAEMDSYAIYEDILRNNIYGVDLNEESVEIARLSLWLKTATKGQKLTALDDNIKCGNSLIKDPSISGDKAFDWVQEFPGIFDNGGFDIVIGNPPYGAGIAPSYRAHLIDHLDNGILTRGFFDTYIAFTLHGLATLLKSDGILSFIMPNTWRLTSTAKSFRELILQGHLYSTVSITQHKERVFADATVDCDTVVIKKSAQNLLMKTLTRVMTKEVIDLEQSVRTSTIAAHDYVNLHLTQLDYNLIGKLQERSVTLGDRFAISSGIKPYQVGKGKPPQTREIVDVKPFTSLRKLDSSFSPLVGGSSFNRYTLFWDDDYWIRYGPWLAEPRESRIFQIAEKLIFRQTADRIIGTLIGSGYVMRDNTHIVFLAEENATFLRFALGIANSTLESYYYGALNPEKGEALAQVKVFHLNKLLLPNVDEDNVSQVGTLVETLLKANEQVVTTNRRFMTLALASVPRSDWPARIQKWWDTDSSHFIGSFRGKLSLMQKEVLLELHEKYQPKLIELSAEVHRIDREIDRLVYELYELTPAEIALVEASV